MTNYGERSKKIREKKNVLKVVPNVLLKSKNDLSTNYTPGVAAVSREIAADKSKIFDLTIKRNSVAVVSDGSAVLGLGNIGPEAALPVMEGKALLFSEFAGIDAFPICLATQNSKEIIQSVKNIAISFGGINLEDISAPRCFKIENALQDIGIPVMHDDQHGTAVVVLAGLINALKIVKKNIAGCKIVISGAGAAGVAVTKLILEYANGSDYLSPRHSQGHIRSGSSSKDKSSPIITIFDSKGAIGPKRKDLNVSKKELLKITKNKFDGKLDEAITGADIFIGVSAPNILTQKMVKSMNKNAIIFAMANPIPEIDPKLAKKGGGAIVATGRSDYPNQINNVLAFPGIFRGALDSKATKITQSMKLAAAFALANYVKKLSLTNIIPSALDKNVTKKVALAVKNAAIKEKVIR